MLWSQSRAESCCWGQNSVAWISSAPREVLGSCLALEPKVAAGTLRCSATCLSSCNVQESHLSLAHSEATVVAAVTLLQWFWKRQVGKMGDVEGALLSVLTGTVSDGAVAVVLGETL